MIKFYDEIVGKDLREQVSEIGKLHGRINHQQEKISRLDIVTVTREDWFEKNDMYDKKFSLLM